MAVDKDKIITLLRQRGPLVPNDIKKTLEADSMIIGAVLSELNSRGQIRITKLKKGSSPFYYLPGQEPLLEKLVEYLNPKDQKTVELLKEKKVIQESSQEMFVRVSLRNIPDYVREFMLQTSQGPYRFWRYYLISETEAMKILEERFAPKKQEVKEPPKEESKENNTSHTENKTEAKNQEKVVETTKNEEKKTEPLPIQNNKKDIASNNSEQKKSEENNTPTKKPSDENQQSLKVDPSLEKTPFYERIIKYFRENDIVLLFEEQISKDREYSFIVKIPSSVGHLKMYVHARHKKKLNEGDVAPALLKAKTKDIPCLFLTDGEFTKKSITLMDKEYKGLVIKKLK